MSGLNNGLCYVADWRQESISEEEEEDLQERVWVQGQYSAAFFDSFFFSLLSRLSLLAASISSSSQLTIACVVDPVLLRV